MLRSSHMPKVVGNQWRRSGRGNRFYNAAFGPKVNKSRLFVLIVLRTIVVTSAVFGQIAEFVGLLLLNPYSSPLCL